MTHHNDNILLLTYAVIRVCHIVNSPLLLKQTQICVYQGTAIAEKLPSSSHLGGNHKTDHFYPKIGTYPIYSEAHIVTKGNEFFHNLVTHGVG